jgi:hypothetical protein
VPPEDAVVDDPPPAANVDLDVDVDVDVGVDFAVVVAAAVVAGADVVPPFIAAT